MESLKAKGVRAVAIKADQGEPMASEPLIRQVVEALGKLDILVNNAAVGWQAKTVNDPDIDDAAMDRQWAINTCGVIANIRAVAKVLSRRWTHHLDRFGSRHARRFPGTADYAATKAAVVGYSKGAARDLGRRNLTVNVEAGVAHIGAVRMLAGST